MSQNKYISFEPWWAGYSNVRMSFEIAIAISEITGRTLIIPPKVYFNGINDWNDTNSYLDIFSIWRKDTFLETFNAVDYHDVEEYASLNSKIGYFNGIDKIAEIKTFSSKYEELHPLPPPDKDFVVYNNIEDQEDFEMFAAGRKPFSVNSEAKFIHFPRNLFGHFYYIVYGSSPDKRNYIKNKIIRGIRFNQDLYRYANEAKKKMGNYNALHIRRGDFLSDRPNMEYDLSAINEFLPDYFYNKPVYIATDEKDKSFFDSLNIQNKHFFSDLYEITDPLREIALDMITCSNAEEFLGSRLSTFSDYINVNRASINQNVRILEYNNHDSVDSAYDVLPWNKDNQSSWHDLSQYYWTPEKDDRKIFINIASYRDLDLIRTIDDAREKAAFPNRLVFGVMLQDEEWMLDRLRLMSDVKIIYCHYKEAKGVGYARNRINNELYNGEEIFLQVDSHCRFYRNWDIGIAQQIDESPENSFLTGFPPDVRNYSEYNDYIQHDRLNCNKILNFKENAFPFFNSRGTVPRSEKYCKTFHVSGSNVFGRGEIVDVIKYDDNNDLLINPFLDQEIYSCLAYIAGYDFYVPKFANVWHNYNDNTERGDKKLRPLWHEDNRLDNYIKNPLHLFKSRETKRTVDQWVAEIETEIKMNQNE